MRSYKYNELKLCLENYGVTLSEPAEVVEEHEGEVLYVRPKPMPAGVYVPEGWGRVTCYQCADGTVQLCRLKKFMGAGVWSIHTDHGTKAWLDGQIPSFKHGYETPHWYVLAPDGIPKDRWVNVLQTNGIRRVILGHVIRPKGTKPGTSLDFHRNLYSILKSELKGADSVD